MKKIIIYGLLFIAAATLSWASGRNHEGQIRLDLRQAGYTAKEVKEIMTLPTITPNVYRMTLDDYSSTIRVTVHENGTFNFHKYYPKDSL